MTIYKRTIKFHDKDNLITISEIEITNRNGYPEFTMCNEHNGGSGQAEFNPKDGYQNDLHNYWDNLHLKKIPDVDNFILTLKHTCDNIEEEEANRFENGIDDWDDIYDEDGCLLDCLGNLDDEKIIALGIHLDITPTEANEDIEQSDDDDCVYSYSGIEYLVCTDEEADEKWDEDLDDYINHCSEIPDHLKNYFDREAWKIDAEQDGRGHFLSRYDGVENNEEVNDITYYIYKQ